jgi:hypothetical protein
MRTIRNPGVRVDKAAVLPIIRGAGYPPERSAVYHLVQVPRQVAVDCYQVDIRIAWVLTDILVHIPVGQADVQLAGWVAEQHTIQHPNGLQGMFEARLIRLAARASQRQTTRESNQPSIVHAKGCRTRAKLSRLVLKDYDPTLR